MTETPEPREITPVFFDKEGDDIFDFRARPVDVEVVVEVSGPKDSSAVGSADSFTREDDLIPQPGGEEPMIPPEVVPGQSESPVTPVAAGKVSTPKSGKGPAPLTPDFS